MAKLLSTIIDGFISSKTFVSGALGSGWKIWKRLGRWIFEVDDLVVRNTMTVFELLISKIRAVKGALGITQASGKIKEIREDDENYYISIDDEMSFVANDIIRCMEFSASQKNYWVIVSSVENEEIVILKSEFVNSSLPDVGDELVQFGNTTDKARQSAIYLHADENGEPAIDVLFGIHEKSFDGCVKIRIGGDIPGEPGKKGFYCENGLIKSVNEAGEVMYLLRPDGSGMMAKGNISWDKDGNGSIFEKAIYWDRDGFHFGSGVKLTWDNLPPDAKEMLKGDKGEPGNDANLLPWIKDWESNKTEIGGEYVISPKIFSGTRDAETGKLTGIFIGKDVLQIDGETRTGIFAVVDDEPVFILDPVNKKYLFKGRIEADEGIFRGEINVNENFKVDKLGNFISFSGVFGGSIQTTLKRINESDAVESGFSPVSYDLVNDLQIDALGYCKVYLPTSLSYVGKRCVIVNTARGLSRTPVITMLMSRDASRIFGVSLTQTQIDGDKYCNEIDFFGGYVELLGVSDNHTPDKCHWMVTGMSGTYLKTSTT